MCFGLQIELYEADTIHKNLSYSVMKMGDNLNTIGMLTLKAMHVEVTEIIMPQSSIAWGGKSNRELSKLSTLRGVSGCEASKRGRT
jgi:hypothetical protein